MTQASTPWKSSVNPWLIALSVMLATFMEVLDTSVANVALPHIAGNLSASTDEATWVLTSYLVANAIVLPATGWLAQYFGRKRFLMVCIVVFTATSCLCGAATSLGFLILARIFQGAAGGALQPMSQAILLESFPQEKRGQAMGIFALGIVVAPIIGPTLGGWITDNYTWRWIFYINIPVGILSLYLIKAYVQDPPYMVRQKGAIDYIGFAFMIVWLALAQIVLDKGQQDDWFGSAWIRYTTFISLVSMICFIMWELRSKFPIVNLRILTNRNFAVGTVLMTMTGGILYGSTVLLPIFLQTLMGYTALLAGVALSPRGVGAFATASLVGRIVGKYDDRVLIAIGFVLLAISNFWLGHIDLQISIKNIIMPVILNGVAISFIFVPLTTLTMGTLTNEQMGNAAGIFNLMRNLGGSIGISVLTTFVARGAQMHQPFLVSHITSSNFMHKAEFYDISHYLSSLRPALGVHSMTSNIIYHHLLDQANLLAFVDNFQWMGVLCAVCLPVIFLFKRVKRQGPPIPMH